MEGIFINFISSQLQGSGFDPEFGFWSFRSFACSPGVCVGFGFSGFLGFHPTPYVQKYVDT